MRVGSDNEPNKAGGLGSLGQRDGAGASGLRPALANHHGIGRDQANSQQPANSRTNHSSGS